MSETMGQSYGKEQHPDFYLPQITTLDDVYEIGVLCEAKVVKDENN